LLLTAAIAAQGCGSSHDTTGTDDLASAVRHSYPYDTQAFFKGTDLGSSVFTSPETGDFTLPSGSPAIGYQVAEPYVPAWLKNAGAY
jgi:hypothetical protein